MWRKPIESKKLVEQEQFEILWGDATAAGPLTDAG